MKLAKYIIAPLLPLMLQACSTTEHTKVTKSTELSDTENALPQTFVMRGELAIGPAARSFTPCGSKSQYWIELTDEAATAGKLLEASSYTVTYAELIGHLEPAENSSDQGGYDGKLMVSMLNMIGKENPQRCQQPFQPTKALGTEPFWSTSIQTDTLTFKTPGKQDQTFSLQDRALGLNVRHYQLNEGELKLRRQICQDTMSETIFGWKANLTVNNNTYSGCALLSNQDPTISSWAGQYSATHKENFSIALELNPDHTAKTTYSYGNQEASRVEKGFWQQVNDRQVQVIMTQHQGIRLISNRLYTRKGKTLSTQEEMVNGSKYTIADGGVVLYKTDN